MSLDILAVILLVVLAGLGYRKGALAQILNLAAVGLAFAAAAPAGRVISTLLNGEASVGRPLTDFGMMALGGGVVFAIATVVGVLIERFFRNEDNEPRALDRVGGGFIGALKAVLVVYLAASGVLSIEAALEDADPDDTLHLRDSRVVELARDAPRPWDFAPKLRKKRDADEDADEEEDDEDDRSALYLPVMKA